MKWMRFGGTFAVLVTSLAYSPHAWPRPEYAVRYNIVQCTACHISPVGGGPRNTNGKLFGARGLKINPFLTQDYVSADFRALYYRPQRQTDSNGGMGVMSASVAGHVALDEKKRVRLTLDHNLGGFSARGAQYRDTYALFRFVDDDGKPHFFESLLVGRFRAPFGIITDEHRTYTRVQTATEWYTFETGLLLSGTPSQNTHYDIGVVSGENSSGDALAQGQSERFGAIVNGRHMLGPVLMGISGSYHDHKPAAQSTQAASVYAVISIARISHEKYPFSLRLEHTRAKNWGARLQQGFTGDPNYGSSLGSAISQGYLAWVDYDFSQRLTFTYKYDRLMPDQTYPADYYERHGIGLRWVAAPNTLVYWRSEFARATHPSEHGSTAIGAQNANFAILQLSL